MNVTLGMVVAVVLALVGVWFIGNIRRNRREKARLEQHEQSVAVLSSHQSGFADRVNVLSYNGLHVSPFSYQGEQAIYLPVGQVSLVVQAQRDDIVDPHQMRVTVAEKSVYHLRYDLSTAQYQFVPYTK
ncbi:hypothetical protein [Spirabiliibacterium falconis]|uniref:hypothetical protein n=1 Tax=Spirabiliibacterium falconis TaxID=572023 RepID=UPI001AAD2CB8|nr:hypothetical protein [Spirabiliibacterium falconis]MBE2893791.1 hypothetical protein [Spirabiliibacterium falconis]